MNQETTQETPQETTQVKILLVEDDESIAQYHSLLFCAWGYELVGVVACGNDAISQAQILSPDLIVMDVELEGNMDGITAAGEIRKINGPPVIFLTAHKDNQRIQRAVETSPSAYITKPCNEGDLRIAVNLALYKHQIETKLSETRSMLVQSERMASIGQLAAGVAHEVNNPLAFVSSNIGTLGTYVNKMLRLIDAYQLVEDRLTDKSLFDDVLAIKQDIEMDYLKDDLTSLLQESAEGVTRVKQIVEDLRSFSQCDTAEWQWVDFNQCLDSTLNIFNYEVEVIRQYGELPEVDCLSGELNQVFMGLLVNAAQAVEEHGTITLRTGTENDGVWVEVTDSGCGMDEETQKKIFEPFFTTKSIGQGTGLGLSHAYGVVQQHNGQITVHSELGKGTTIRLWLPVRQENRDSVSFK